MRVNARGRLEETPFESFLAGLFFFFSMAGIYFLLCVLSV